MEVFSGFAQRRWGWQPDPAGVRLTTDVSVVIVEALRVLICPGDAVIPSPATSRCARAGRVAGS